MKSVKRISHQTLFAGIIGLFGLSACAPAEFNTNPVVSSKLAPVNPGPLSCEAAGTCPKTCEELGNCPTKSCEDLGTCVKTCEELGTCQTAQKVTEDFYQDLGNDMVDILIVNDNSSSMVDDQKKFGSKFQSFMSKISDLDFHIGITTTDVSNGLYGIRGTLVPIGSDPYVAGINPSASTPRFLTKSTPNLERNFLDTIVRHETDKCVKNPNEVCPSGNEQPLRAIQMAVAKRASDNRGFFRDEADLAVVILTDEDEASTGAATLMQRPKETLDLIQNTWPGKQLLSYGIFIQPGDSACSKEQKNMGNVGNILWSFMAITNGASSSICNKDFGPSLEDLSQKIRRLVTSFELKGTPKPGTLSVRLFPEEPDNSWSYVGNRIVFSKPPKPRAHIQVSFEKQ